MIQYSIASQQNIQASSEPQFQEWGPVNNTVTYYWSNLTSLTLTPTPIVIKQKDFMGTQEYGQYSQFRLIRQTSYQPSGANFLTNSSYSFMFPVMSDISSNGISYSFYPVFQNLNQLPEGTYFFKLEFMVEGLNSSGNWNLISGYWYYIKLVVTNQLVEYLPSNLNFTHTQNTTLPTKNIALYGSEWSLTLAPNFDVSVILGQCEVTTETSFGNTFKVVQGSGEAELQIQLTNYFNGNFNSNQLNYSFVVKAGNTIIGYIPVLVNLLNLNEFYANKTSLNFEAVKGIEEPLEQYIIVYTSNPPYTFSVSPWLLASIETVNNNGIEMEALVIVPIPTANMEPGVYNGEIILECEINNVLSQITIPVTYDLQGFVVNPYPLNQNAFTLDAKFFEFNTAFVNTYMQLTSLIKVFNFNGSVEEKTIREKIGLYQGKGKIAYGNLVHKLMKRFSKPDSNELQYKGAFFDLKIEEVDQTSGEVIREADLLGLRFFAGLSNNLNNGYGFLEFNNQTSRVTNEGIACLNLLYPSGLHTLKVFKNNELHELIQLPESLQNTHYINYSFEQFIKGDKIDFKITSPENETLATKTYYVLPSQKYSWMLVWESEFLLPSSLECTGSLMVKSELEFLSNTVFRNLVEVIDYIETNKVDKITVSTGWLLQTQIDEIESLMASKRVWILDNNKQVELRPLTKSYTSIDKERELVEFNIEFQINRSYDKETYRF